MLMFADSGVGELLGSVGRNYWPAKAVISIIKQYKFVKKSRHHAAEHSRCGTPDSPVLWGSK
ncbi:hypothetical protein AYO27_16895 [Rhizobium sp. GHKF11]|nr:hypothetical protein AYO27_16895 [Rhizobium sp. GHKF11]